ncbi:MAG: hypothetical protein NXI24_01705 [bacterium]|nr:hypothetical protein [bacterium]
MSQTLQETLDAAIEARKHLGEFAVEFDYTVGGVENTLTIDGEFYQSGNTKYARFQSLSLRAGSHTKDLAVAKFRALARLLTSFLTLLERRRQTDNYRNLLLRSNPALEKQLLEFAQSPEFRAPPIDTDGDSIPVFEEDFVLSEDGSRLQYRLYNRAPVNDMSQIEQVVIDNLSERKGEQPEDGFALGIASEGSRTTSGRENFSLVS